MTSSDTIFALSTARGRAGVAVIRISGPASDNVLLALAAGVELPMPRALSLRHLRDPRDGSLLDEALVVRFLESSSFTGEPSVEIQCHGGPAVVAAILDTISSLENLKPAEPGEFTRRAFENGCLDLAQIEGLADLIAAETDAQRRAALRQADGSLGRACRDWSTALTKALALLEATIDFSDEEIPDATYDAVNQSVFHVKQAIHLVLSNVTLSERFRDGWRIALIGAPNAGKSSLLNALTQRDVAITSPIAGTTRDTIEVGLDLKGFPVILVDTAGLRATDDMIESLGVERARVSAETADLRIALAAPDAPLDQAIEAVLKPDDLRIWNKTDISDKPPAYDLGVSVTESDGLGMLISLIAERLEFADPSNASAVLRDRHQAALEDALTSLNRFTDLAESERSPVREAPEIAAEYLRYARAAIGTITGDVGVERLLDVIFSEFCLGK